MNRALLFQAMEPKMIPKGGPPNVQQLKAPLGPIEPLALWGVNDYNTASAVLPCAYQGMIVGRTPNATPRNVVNIIGGQSRSQENSVCNGFRPLNLPLQAPTWSLSGARPVAWAVKSR